MNFHNNIGKAGSFFLFIMVLVAMGLLNYLNDHSVNAGESYTVNSSATDNTDYEPFVHEFTLGGVDAGLALGLPAYLAAACNTTDCDNVGRAVLLAGGTGFWPTLDTTAGGGYDLAPGFNAFGSADMAGHTSHNLSESIDPDWVTLLKANGSNPITSPVSPEVRQQFVDQLLINFVTDDHYNQNFRTLLTFGDSDYNAGVDEDQFTREQCPEDYKTVNPLPCSTIVDQRLEQGDTDIGNEHASMVGGPPVGMVTGPFKYAFQQAFGTVGNTANASYTAIEGDLTNTHRTLLSQNVEQNMVNFFYTCVNCSINGSYAFSAPRKLLMAPSFGDFNSPTITSIVSDSDSVQTAAFNW